MKSQTRWTSHVGQRVSSPDATGTNFGLQDNVAPVITSVPKPVGYLPPRTGSPCFRTAMDLPCLPSDVSSGRSRLRQPAAASLGTNPRPLYLLQDLSERK